MTNITPVYLSKQEEAKIKKKLAQRKYREKQNIYWEFKKSILQ
jgi:hypothetical protein